MTCEMQAIVPGLSEIRQKISFHLKPNNKFTEVMKTVENTEAIFNWHCVKPGGDGCQGDQSCVREVWQLRHRLPPPQNI